MTFSTSSSSNRAGTRAGRRPEFSNSPLRRACRLLRRPAVRLALAVAFFLTAGGCAGHPPQAMGLGATSGAGLVAVLPFENLSGAPAPLAELRSSLIGELRRQGVQVVGEEALAAFMARHRLRHTGGLDGETALAFREELGVSAAMISTLELYQDQDPPKISLFCRLVTTGSEPAILWMDGIGLAGDQSPGLLELGLVNRIDPLRERAIARLGESLARFKAGAVDEGENGFSPSIHFRSPLLGDESAYRVAILPFVNESERGHAGDLVALHFVRELVRTGKFRVIEPGVVRGSLTRNRVIMPEGASLDVAGLLAEQLDADLLLSGKSIEYQDYRGADGAPRVYFSAQAIEKKSGEIVWASQSHRSGDQGVFFFGLGKVATAHELASRLVRRVAELMAAPAGSGRLLPQGGR